VAKRLYAGIVEAVRRPQLYLDYGVPDTLQGRFEITVVHLFTVLRRLLHDPGDDPELAQLVSEAFVTDMDVTLRELGIGDMSVPKHVKAYYGSFAARSTEYAHALEKNEDAFVAAVSRNVLSPDTESQHADRLEAYSKRLLAAVRAADRSDLLRGVIGFPDVVKTDGEASKP
jgi:cytochrome b pre-mRNA-processing protein 3